MCMNYILFGKLLLLAVAAGLLGFALGRRTAHKPAGRIVFEKKEDGHELCIFKLQQDEEWLSQQKSVIFEILHVGEGYECEPYVEKEE